MLYCKTPGAENAVRLLRISAPHAEPFTISAQFVVRHKPNGAVGVDRFYDVIGILLPPKSLLELLAAWRLIDCAAENSRNRAASTP